MDNPAHRQLVNDLTREGESFHDSSPKIVTENRHRQAEGFLPALPIFAIGFIYVYISALLFIFFFVFKFQSFFLYLL